MKVQIVIEDWGNNRSDIIEVIPEDESMAEFLMGFYGRREQWEVDVYVWELGEGPESITHWMYDKDSDEWNSSTVRRWK